MRSWQHSFGESTALCLNHPTCLRVEVWLFVNLGMAPSTKWNADEIRAFQSATTDAFDFYMVGMVGGDPAVGTGKLTHPRLIFFAAPRIVLLEHHAGHTSFGGGRVSSMSCAAVRSTTSINSTISITDSSLVDFSTSTPLMTFHSPALVRNISWSSSFSFPVCSEHKSTRTR